jgi:small conductance mechanosensitive channel
VIALSIVESASTAGARAVQSVGDACGEDPGYLCEQVFDVTNGNESLARLADWLIGVPLSILTIVTCAFVATWAARRWVDRVVAEILKPPSSRRLYIPGLDVSLGPENSSSREREERMNQRREARAASISSVMVSTISVLVWVIAGLLILGELGIDLAPLIAGAGIAGVAIGFGAQQLVKDCISGLFMLLEDQYGIGDVVDLGEASGTVEEIALRTTVLRGSDGTVWHVPNGEVQRVGNQSQHWSTALIDLDVAYGTDVAVASEVMKRTADEVCSREPFSELVLDEPQVLGVEMLGADAVTLRMTVTTTPGSQWKVQRELRSALKSAFDAADIEIPFPQRTIWLRNE